MATTLHETESGTTEIDRTQLPDASALEDKVPDSLKLSASATIYVALVGFIFLFYCYQPLWHTDLWGHLAYGEVLWTTKSLPATEPLMPLSSGVPYIDTAWLTQVIAYLAYDAVGVTSMSFLYALAIGSCVSLMLWRFQAQTRSVVLSSFGIAVFLIIEWKQLGIVRPQLAGFLCFVALFAMLTTRNWRRWFWWAVPVLFALWANLHGSFPVGLVMLGDFAVGRAVDKLRRSRSIRAMIADRKLWRYVMLTELAAVAVLCNPYGLRLYAEVLAFSSSPNLVSIVEWQALDIRMFQGKVAAGVVLVLMFLYRMTPRRVSFVEVLLLVGFGAAALWTSRMILWWAPIAAYYVVTHLSAIVSRRKKHIEEYEPPVRSGRWSLVAAMLVWVCFGFTPFAARVMHGRDKDMNQATSNYTPVAAVAYLNEHPPKGQVFNTYEWGDYLLWNGPKDMQIFVASHAHLVPREVWRDYLNVVNRGDGWEAALERYGANTVIIDYRYRRSLIQALKRKTEDWELTFDDNDRAAIFVRKKPIL